MARKRMFDMEIVDTDLFLDMPQSSQNLYFHLGMRADDDGFVSNPKKIVKIIGANEDDLKLLFLKKFVIPFESGIVVIRHWKLNNYLRKDRYVETIYKEEKKQLIEDENGVYSLGIPNGNQTDTQYSIEENSIEENSIEIYSPAKAKQDIPYKEIIDYLNMRLGSNYKYTTKKTKELIKARFNEGFSLDNFKIVIDKKCVEWINTDMQKYLRPETLFGTKFESYLNQVVKERKITTKDIQDKIDFSDF